MSARGISLKGIFILALAVRLILLVEYTGSPFFELLAVGADAYHRLALGFPDGTWPGERSFF
jgi:hypothetical protein